MMGRELHIERLFTKDWSENMLEVRKIEPELTYNLRQTILRPNQAIEDSMYDTDHDDNVFHVGAFYQGKLISVASFIADNHPDFAIENQYRLRQMATHEEYRKFGAGRAIVNYAENVLKKQGVFRGRPKDFCRLTSAAARLTPSKSNEIPKSFTKERPIDSRSFTARARHSGGPVSKRGVELGIHRILTARSDTELAARTRCSDHHNVYRDSFSCRGRRLNAAEADTDFHSSRNHIWRPDTLVGLQSRPAMVAKARDRDGRLLLVLDPAGGPLRAHRPDGSGCCLYLWNPWRRCADQVL